MRLNTRVQIHVQPGVSHIGFDGAPVYTGGGKEKTVWAKITERTLGRDTKIATGPIFPDPEIEFVIRNRGVTRRELVNADVSLDGERYTVISVSDVIIEDVGEHPRYLKIKVKRQTAKA